ncbi:MAG TPA: helix-turn-helix domain-containing protein [Bryobacteraceae bacterium]|jgi:DNA-binding XRE family transcriptional regulator|nr:helix-turn-helix domain-containing protein [Bryobacteraceae bacterium]
MVEATRVLVLPDALIDCRARHFLTLEDVASAVGVSRASISNIERRICQPKRTTRLLLVEFLRKRGYEIEEVA